MNPAGAGIDNRFETAVRDETALVRDVATGLVGLNERGYAGHRDRRLPTAGEAASLMEKTRIDGRHIDPVFGSGVSFIWTADRTPDGRVYAVYWADGRLSAEQPEFHAWLRAVR